MPQAQQSQQHEDSVTAQQDVAAQGFQPRNEFITDEANGAQHPKHANEDAFDEYGLGNLHRPSSG